VDDTLDELKDANFYTHLDLAYGQVRVRDQDIHTTAFQTLDGLMEWVIMPFGLYNAPATFQRMMNDILRDWPVPTTQKEVRSFVQLATSMPYLFVISATLRLH
jgi:hypothetical protein